MTTRGMKGARITSPDLQQSRQKADSAQGWRDRPDTFKTPFADAHVNVSTAQEEQQRKNFPPWWFLPIHLHRELLPQAVLDTQRGTEAEGWDGRNSSHSRSAQQKGLPHVHSSGDAGLGAALLHLSICNATLQPHDFISACSGSETSVKMVIRLPGLMLLFWELDCRKNLLSRWDGHDYSWGSVWERIQWQSETKFHGKGKNPNHLWFLGWARCAFGWKKTGDLMTHALGGIVFWVMRDHGDSGLWLLFLGTACSSQKHCCFLGSSEILCMSCAKCQKGWQPSCEEVSITF